MAVGGFNGTDPSPTLDQFVRLVDEGQIHYFIEGRMMMARGSAEGATASAAIREWVQARYPAQTVNGAVVYDLTEPGVISQPVHSSGQR